MSKIERAIETLEDEVRILYGHGNLVDKDTINAHELALKLLRAELEREKNPLTCDGCDRPAYWCTGCKRRKDLPDHYQPKGEKA